MCHKNGLPNNFITVLFLFTILSSCVIESKILIP